MCVVNDKLVKVILYSYNIYKHAYHCYNLCLYYPLDTYVKMAEKVDE